MTVYRQCKELVAAAEQDLSDLSESSQGSQEHASPRRHAKDETTCDTTPRQNQLKREQQPDKMRRRGRPKMTSSQKEQRRLARERGEAIQIKGYIGKDYEQVFDESGKAIGKKD